MANFFDQLDTPADAQAPVPATTGNFFDQLDGTEPTKKPLRISIGPKPIEANNGELSGATGAAGSEPAASNPVADFVRSIPGGLIQWPANMARGEQIESEQRAAAFGQPNAGPEVPTGNAAAEAVGLPTPQGAGGRFGQSVGEFLGNPASFIGPGGVVRKGVGAILGGIGSQGGAESGIPGGSLIGGAIGGLTAAPRAPIAAAAEVAAPTTKQLFDAAKGGYQSVAGAGNYSPAMMESLVGQVEQTLKSQNSRDYLAPGVFRAVQELGGENSVEGVHNVRSLLGSIAQNGDKETRRAAKIAQGEIDNFLEKNSPDAAAAIKEADANYAAASRSQRLNTVTDVADLRTGRAGYGGNAVNAMRQVLSPIVEKAIKGKSQGFSPEEISAMRDIVEGTRLTNTLRGAGMLSPEKGALSLGVAAEVGHHIAGMHGAIGLPILGKAANRLADVMTGKQIDRLSELIRKRSPLYQQVVARAADQYASTADTAIAQPSQQSFIKFVVAARSLAAGFKKDGIDISSGDLIRRIQSPVPAHADENQ